MKEVTWSEDQTMKQESGGFVYRVPLGRGYEVSILSTAYSYGGREGLYEIALVDADGELGIIPAGAGLTTCSAARISASRDHPRGCGAHCAAGP